MQVPFDFARLKKQKQVLRLGRCGGLAQNDCQWLNAQVDSFVFDANFRGGTRVDAYTETRGPCAIGPTRVERGSRNEMRGSCPASMGRLRCC